MATIDLKELIRMKLKLEPCGMAWFGMSIASKVITKIMKEVVTHLTQSDFKSVVYLDDVCCL